MSYGCFNREPLKTSRIIQDGFKNAGFMGPVIRLIEIQDPMTKHCNYSRDDKYNDPQCVGCKHKEVKHEG